jgi:hypothetical protein
MTITTRHAAPWTFRRLLACLLGQRTTARYRAARPDISRVLTAREAAARHLFGEAVQWSVLDMLEYDHTPYLQGAWLAEADRRIAGGPVVAIPDLVVLRWCGCQPDEWNALPAMVKADKREQFFQSRGM